MTERLDDNSERQLRLLLASLRRNVATFRAAGRQGEVHVVVRVERDGNLTAESEVTVRERPLDAALDV